MAAKPTGRPPKEIPVKTLEKLCGLACTDEDLADFFSVSVSTIRRKRKEKTIAAAMARGQAKGRISLRRAQFKAALEGNITAQIWLGKQLLGQRSYEKPDDGKAAIAIPPFVIQAWSDDAPAAPAAAPVDPDAPIDPTV
jgi:hypothetical protein